VKDPGPNLLEQQIETNALLTAILAASGGAAPGLPGTYNPDPIIYPNIFYDNGDGTFNYRVTADGADFIAAYATEAAFVGLNGIHLKTRTTEHAASDSVTVIYEPGRPLEKLLTLQALFARAQTNEHFWVHLAIGFSIGAQLYQGEVRFNMSTGDADYLNSFTPNKQYTVGLSAGANHEHRRWNIFKLGIDLTALTYRTMQINERSVDLSALSLPYTATTVAHKTHIELGIVTWIDEICEAYFDQLLVTPT